MAGFHDSRYKKLFSDPDMLRELLESFVDESFIKDLDYSSLKKLDKSFVTEDFKTREADLIFSISFKEKDLYIFLLLEFQSSVDRYMALRFLRYICEFYQMLDKRGIKTLPPVFPLLLYNGDSRWSAERCFEKLVQPLIPACYIPQFRYFVIAENEYPQQQLLELRNAVAAVFLTENLDVEEFEKAANNLYNMLRHEKPKLVRQFSRWFNDYLKRLNVLEENRFEIERIEEDPKMLATKIREHDKRIREEGMLEGLEMGLQKGVEQGKAQGLEQGVEQGLEQGKTQTLVETAERLKDRGFSREQIADMLGIPVEDLG